MSKREKKVFDRKLTTLAKLVANFFATWAYA